MPAPRPTLALATPQPGGRRGKANARSYRSNCKLCPFGVYTGQDAVWLSSPVGLSHKACAERAGKARPA